jgi:hypothetical protein
VAAIKSRSEADETAEQLEKNSFFLCAGGRVDTLVSRCAQLASQLNVTARMDRGQYAP